MSDGEVIEPSAAYEVRRETACPICGRSILERCKGKLTGRSLRSWYRHVSPDPLNSPAERL